MPTGLADLEDALSYRFTTRKLLLRALTHSSSANEELSGEDNETLEFLGDSVLGWIVSEWLFHHFADFTEGQLSFVKNYLVSASHLVSTAQKLDLGTHLQLGKGEDSAGGRTKQRLLVNAFEAVLAAVYLDGGPDAAKAIVLQNVLPDKTEITKLAGAEPPEDFRAELERITRERSLPRPEYVLKGEGGPGHARVFTVEVKIGRRIAATGEGSSKKAASHKAAQAACRSLSEIE